MAITPKERGNIMLYVTIFAAIGVLGSVVVPLIYLGDIPDIEGFRLVMVLSGIFSGIVFFAASYFIKENEYTRIEEPLGFWESIKVTFNNKPFLILEVAIYSMVIMQQIFVSYFIFLFDYVVSIEITLLNVILILVLAVIVGFVVFWLNNNLDRVGMKNGMMFGGIVGIGGFLSLLIIGLSMYITFSSKMPLALVIGPLAGFGIGLIIFMLLNQPIMGDCMDYDETLTGKRRETSYAGMNALLTKPSVSIGHALFLWIIELYGYDETIKNPALQPASLSTGVVIAFTVVPIICLTIGVIALNFFPLHGEEWLKQKQELQKIHAKKELEYLEHLKRQESLEGEKMDERKAPKTKKLNSTK
jgi:Na+/melibiose symporter-like transporter